MKSRLDSQLRHVMLLAALLGTGLARAQVPATDVDTSEWLCEFCPFATGSQSSIEVRGISVSDESAYIGDARGYDDDGGYLAVDGEGRWSGDQSWLRWTASDVGLGSASVAAQFALRDTFDLAFEYREFPRRRFLTSASVFRTGANGQLELPADWVYAPLTSGFTTLDSNLRQRPIEADRSLLELSARYAVAAGTTIRARIRHHELDGNQMLGGAYFTQGSLLPAPVGQSHDEFELGVQWSHGRGFVALDGHLSRFDNDTGAVVWQSPFTTAAGAELGRLARPPSNEFRRVSLAGVLHIPTISSAATFSLSGGRAEQNQPLLPYTTNAALDIPLPATYAGAQADTSHLFLSLTSRPFARARVLVAYRYDERDNDTPVRSWNRIIANTFPSSETLANVPYRWQRASLEGRAEYQLSRRLQVSAGGHRRSDERDYQAVSKQTETAGWGQLRWRPGAALVSNVELRAGAERREPDSYDEAFALELGENPLLRKYNLAYRYREFVRAKAAFTSEGGNLTATVSGQFADDSYTQSTLGLTEADDFHAAVDLSWAPNERIAFYADAALERLRSRQLGSEGFATADWGASNDDEFRTLGTGVSYSDPDGRSSVRFRYTHSFGTSGIELNGVGGRSRFPDLESDFDDLRLDVDYRMSERLTWTAMLRYIDFATADWSRQGVDPATIPVILSLGAAPYDDSAFIVALGVRFDFGSDSAAL